MLELEFAFAQEALEEALNAAVETTPEPEPAAEATEAVE